MARRRALCTALTLGLGVAFLSFGRVAEAETTESPAPSTRAVLLERGAWPATSAPAFAAPSTGTYVRTGLSAPSWGDPVAQDGVVHAVSSPALETSPRHFRFTTIRIWAYRNFLPKSKDADILGLESNSAWSIGNLDFTNISYLEVADYPRPVPGMPFGNEAPGRGAATGISDLLSAFLVSPRRAHHGPHHFSAGLAMQLPTASDNTLGSGKWAMGPAVEYEYEKGRFFAAFVVLQLWSFAGDPDRKNVNMLMIKPMITYELSRHWKALYMPYGISVYWEKKREDMVYVPLGGGVQYDFHLRRQKMGVSLQFFNYVLRPAKGAENEIRFLLEFDF